MGDMRFTTLRLCIAVIVPGALAAAEPARYELDAAHTTIAFLVERSS
jgi:polyisoprenoid-binding protein YceI